MKPPKSICCFPLQVFFRRIAASKGRDKGREGKGRDRRGGREREETKKEGFMNWYLGHDVYTAATLFCYVLQHNVIDIDTGTQTHNVTLHAPEGNKPIYVLRRSFKTGKG